MTNMQVYRMAACIPGQTNVSSSRFWYCYPYPNALCTFLNISNLTVGGMIAFESDTLVYQNFISLIPIRSKFQGNTWFVGWLSLPYCLVKYFKRWIRCRLISLCSFRNIVEDSIGGLSSWSLIQSGKHLSFLLL